MIFFFHHYELPAILRRGAHIVREGEVLEGQLEIEILNPPPPAENNANDNEAVQNTEININTNEASPNTPENSTDPDTQEWTSNSNSASTDGATSSLRQRHGDVINTSSSSNAPSSDVEFPVNGVDNRTS